MQGGYEMACLPLKRQKSAATVNDLQRKSPQCANFENYVDSVVEIDED